MLLKRLVFKSSALYFEIKKENKRILTERRNMDLNNVFTHVKRARPPHPKEELRLNQLILRCEAQPASVRSQRSKHRTSD